MSPFMTDAKVYTDFFIGGAPKCGTTSVWNYLSEHPEIYMGEEKETYFFTHKWEKGIDWYNTKFRNYDDEKVVGDGSINLLVSEKAIDRVQKLIEHPRFIFIFRNPVKRLISDYKWALQQGRPPARGNSFSEYLEEARKAGSYRLEFGLYHKHLTRFEARFGAQSVQPIFFQDFRSDPVGTAQRLYDFLGVDEKYVPDVQVHNGSGRISHSPIVDLGYKVIEVAESATGLSLRSGLTTAVRRILYASSSSTPTVSPSDKEFLFSYYRDDIRALQDHLDRDLSAWLDSIRPD